MKQEQHRTSQNQKRSRSRHLSPLGGWTKLKAKSSGYFRVDKIKNRWWFITPQGHAFLSLGVNHADSSMLKHPDNIHVYQNRYKNDKNWAKNGLAKDLKNWGFNTIGWCQNAVIWHKNFGRSGPVWRVEQYQSARMPYCHLLPFTDIGMWGTLSLFPDVFSGEFEEWCDYIARSHCVDMSEDPMLVGYFYSDIPNWGMQEDVKSWIWKYDLKTDSGRKQCSEIARRYYAVIHDAIRRYDKNHLLLGDRYNGQWPLPEEVLSPMKDTVDVLSVQYFDHFEGEMKKRFDHWAEMTKKPVLLADCAFIAPTPLLSTATRKYQAMPAKNQKERGQAYVSMATAFLSQPYAVGWHWCSYMENPLRCHGLKNRFDEPYTECVNAMAEFNHRVYEIIDEESTL